MSYYVALGSGSLIRFLFVLDQCFFILGPIDILSQIVLFFSPLSLFGCCPVHFRIFSFYPLDAVCTPAVVTPTDGFKHCQMSPAGQNFTPSTSPSVENQFVGLIEINQT